ncbi:MAG: sensor domain-containing diguanylate cyclase [Xanthomonadaceae bacterium]|nr:sensor domain-containing diguanylate cyclase [Xanthomonadaceae bacterium]MDP2186781.1 sensor domain-containing diguanylate cyclase [Xanthomonadales bacterium]MDZ4114386.1 sensor domain-containing diguanylate cyclase [Xanthomonadaceae bacterium]MDZ4378754.1 sensor domain-containing diguanylate cyclase [Xanthomonadaceae bacterium]
MKKPDIPQDEHTRLKTLRSLDVLDTLSEERFDRLTRLAKRMFRVPIALVSLVDENRQWFKSCIGLDASETSRDISFCGHAILGNGVFIIPDTMEDQRFADNPLVLSDPSIRFYAGCPLSLNGYKLGTLCIIDQKPRSFENEDIEALRDLASMVERELASFQLATVDELTNISNRRGFMVLAQQSLNLCARQRIPATLVFMDLDKFKPINDKFGHAEGDLALITFANQMKSSFRDSDVVARLGGDEFVVLLTNTSKLQAEEFIARFDHSLKKYNQEEDRGYDIAFSHGVVEFSPEKHPAIEELLANGDSIMYEVKKAKR